MYTHTYAELCRTARLERYRVTLASAIVAADAAAAAAAAAAIMLTDLATTARSPGADVDAAATPEAPAGRA